MPLYAYSHAPQASQAATCNDYTGMQCPELRRTRVVLRRRTGKQASTVADEPSAS